MNVFQRILTISVFGLAGVAVTTAQTPPVRIMPLGDSITEGCCSDQSHGSYRNLLYTLLTNAGYNVDFVGTEADVGNLGLPDVNHQGVDGFRLENIEPSIGVWLKAVDDPDVILLHAGTNDFWGGASLEVVQQRMKNVIGKLATLRPHAKIIVASLVLRGDSIESIQAEFAQSLPQIVSEQIALGRKVSFVDLHSLLLPEDLMAFDQVHTRGTGFSKMAQGWFPAITSVISPSGTTNPPMIASVSASSSLTQVIVNFSKPVEDAAAATTNYSLSGGVSVSAAVLDSVSKRRVTLTTSSLVPSTPYTLTVNNILDRTPAQLPVPPGSAMTFTSRSILNGSFEDGIQDWIGVGAITIADSPVPTSTGTKVASFQGSQDPLPGSLSQTFSTLVGQRYRIEFDMGVVAAATASRSLKVSVTGSTLRISHTEVFSGFTFGRSNWLPKTLDFVADSSTTTLNFLDTSEVSSGIDLLVDDVRLRADNSPELLVNGGFEVGEILPSGLTNLNGWTVVGNAVGVISDAPYSSSEGNRMGFFNIGGDDFTGMVSQTFATEVGKAYSVSYDVGVIGPLGRKQGLLVSVTGAAPAPLATWEEDLEVESNTLIARYERKIHSFVADSSTTTLSFSDAPSTAFSTLNSDLLLDDVRVVESLPRTLAVKSVLATAVNIAVSPQDLGNNSDGLTDFTRSYLDGNLVTLTAPSASGGKFFQKWQSDGFDITTQPIAQVVIEGSKALTAVYIDNTPPLATDDLYVTTVDTPRSVLGAAGVLANDSDNTLVDALEIASFTQPAHGNVVLNKNGSFMYTPDIGYEGPDSFTYHATDGTLISNVATVSLSIIQGSGGFLDNGGFEIGDVLPSGYATLESWTVSGNAVGLISNPPYSSNEGSRMAFFNIGGNDFTGVISQTFDTVVGQEYSVSYDMGVIGPFGRKQGLSVVVTGSAPSPLGTWEEELEVVSTSLAARYVRKVHRFIADNTTTTVTFSDAPSAGFSTSNSDLLLDDVVVELSVPRTLAVNSELAAGVSITVSPSDLANTDNGVTSFTRSYLDGDVVLLTAPRVSSGNFFQKWQEDGQDLTTDLAAEVLILGNNTLTAVYIANVAPLAVADVYTTTNGAPRVVSTAAGVLVNDSDSTLLSALEATLDTPPAFGQVDLEPDGSFTYMPAPGYVGVDSFTYYVSDGDLLSNVVTVTLTVIQERGGLLKNGSFEVGDILPSEFYDLNAWNVEGNAVGVISFPPYSANEGDRMAFFNIGGDDFDGVVSQTFNTVVGDVYSVSYDMGVIGPFGRKQGLLVTVAGDSPVPFASWEEELEVESATLTARYVRFVHQFTAVSNTTTLTFSDAPSAGFSTTNSDLLLDDVNVSLINALPVAVNDGTAQAPALTVFEDSSASTPIAVLLNDSDIDSASLTVISASSTNGAVVINPNGTLVLTPTANFNGLATIGYTISDGEGGTASATVFVAVTSINDFPVAADDGSLGVPFLTVAEDSGASVALAVLGNDSDVESPLLTITAATSPNGVVEINVDQTLTFTPALNFNGPTTISYTVSDGQGGTDVATVFILVTPVNDPPVADNQAVTVNEDGTLSIFLTASDDENLSLTFAVFGGPSHGRLQVNGSVATYIPNPNYFGPDSFNFIAFNLTGSPEVSQIATVSITVNPINDAPTVTDVANQSTGEDVPVSAVAFTVGDLETTVGDLTLSATSSDTSLIPVANIAFGGSDASRTMTLTPAANQSGTSTITLTVSDGGLTTSDTFVFTVNPLNDAPTITDVVDQSTNEDTASSPIAFTLGDLETPIGDLTVSATSSDTSLVPIANIVFGGSDANRTVTVTPAANQSGTSTIILTVNDGGLSASEAFVFTVNPINDAPTITDVVNQSTNEDAATSPVAFTVGDLETAVVALTVSATSSNTSVVPLTNIEFGGSGASRTVTVIPAANQSGVSTITLTVSDGSDITSDTFVLTVNPLNDAPTISDVVDQSTNEDTATSAIAFTIGDLETAVASLTFSATSSNASLIPPANIVFSGSSANRTVTVTPAANQSGTSTITITIGDGSDTVSDIFVLTVNPINDAPTINDVVDQSTNEDTATSAVAFTVGDLETAVGGLTVSATSSNTSLVPLANIVFGGSGASRSVTVTPAANQNGTATITLTVSDGSDATSDTFVLTVDPFNDAPTINDVVDQSTNEDTTTSAVALIIGDLEAAVGDLTVSATSSNTSLVPLANIVFGGSGANRTVTVAPAANQSGISTITLTVSDGGLTASDNFVLTVNPLNDAPTITDVADQSTNEDIATSAIAFTIGDLETAVASLVVSAASSNTSLVPLANVMLGGSGVSRTVTVVPAANQSGTSTITLSVSDGGLITSDTFVLTVNAVNDAPTITDVADQSTNEDTATSAIAFTIGDLETAVASLVVSATSSNTVLVPLANVVIGGSGANRTVTTTPAANQSGTSTITLSVSDGGLTTSDTFVLTVNAVNDAPTITDVANQSTNEDTATSAIAFSIGDLETAVTSLAVSAASSNTVLVPLANVVFGGSGANRTVTVTPAANQSGTSTITLSVSDGALTTSDTFVLTVSPVNDAPTITDVVNQSTDEDTAIFAIALTVGDLETAVGSLVVSATSSNTVLVPLANVLFGGSGANRTVTVIPAANQNGTSTITLTVSDGALTTSDTFVLTVNPVNDAPTITDVANQSTNEDTATSAIAFTIGDLETAVASLVVSATSSNTVLVPLANVVIGGSGANRIVTVTPATNQSGTSTITLSVSDGGLTTSDTFVLTVNSVDDVPTITDVANQSTNEDTGTSAIAFTVGDLETAVTSLAVSAASSNTVLVPLANVVFGGSGANRTVTVTPAANQSGTSTITLTVSDGALTTSDTFVLTVNPVNDAPTITDVANQSTNEDTAIFAIALTVGDLETAVASLAVSATSSNTALVPLANVLFGGSGANRTATVIPAANQNGTSTITLTVSDGELTTSDTFVLTVNPLNDAPTITDVANQSINEDNVTSAIAFTIGDLETAVGDLTVNAASSNIGLVPLVNVVLGGSGANRTVTLTPAFNQSGTSTITLSVSDGQFTLSDTFILTVNPVNDAPTITDVANQSTNEDTATSTIAFAVGDLETAVASLTVSATSSNTDLVPLGNIVFGGSNANRTVTMTPAPNQSGTSTITLTVSDNGLTTSDTFILTVNPLEEFAQWLATFSLNSAPGVDSDGDSISNAVEYVIGGNPKNQSNLDLMPTVALVAANLDGNPGNEDYLLFTYRRTDIAKDDPSTIIRVEWSTSLTGSWSSTSGMVQQVTDGAVFDLVKVYIPRSLAIGGKLFARLGVVIAPASVSQ